MNKEKLEYKEGFKDKWIDSILELHNKTEMGRSLELRDKFLRAYRNRHSVITCWDGEKLIGFGTLISDGEMYSSIYDMVVDPEYQKKGVGREIVNRLVKAVSDTYINLTSTSGNEEFYQKVGFQKHKAAFVKYPWKSN